MQDVAGFLIAAIDTVFSSTLMGSVTFEVIPLHSSVHRGLVFLLFRTLLEHCWNHSSGVLFRIIHHSIVFPTKFISFFFCRACQYNFSQ